MSDFSRFVRNYREAPMLVDPSGRPVASERGPALSHWQDVAQELADARAAAMVWRYLMWGHHE